MYRLDTEEIPEPLAPARWDWSAVQRVLLVRLRSIGDTVLSTASVYALKRFLPNAAIDVLVEDWVAPVLQAHPSISKVVTLQRSSLISRAKVARQLRAARYDVAYNLHGGTTASMLTRASGANHRVGFASYQYSQFHNHRAPSPLLLWGQQKTHSVEQQLALLGWTGIPVTDRPATQLGITSESAAVVIERLAAAGLGGRKFAVVHPAAAFATKQWAADNFARVAEFLADRGLATVAIAAPHETPVLETLTSSSKVGITVLHLSLPEVSALLSKAQLFVGNDSGIAHMAAALGIPTAVVFGSSNIAHWRPWSRSRSEVIFEPTPCQPCHGYFCEKFQEPECILRVPVSRVTAAVDRLISAQ
ncbi:MAG: glycosyltransferase family 9 protein [Pyrinomonadaceae bacterium]